MQFLSPIVQITHGSSRPRLFSWDDLRAVSETYEQIWERDARWIMGRTILKRIVMHWRDTEPVIEYDPASNLMNIAPSLPTIRNEIDGEEVSVCEMVPYELRHIFESRCNLPIEWRFPSLEPSLSDLVGAPMTEHSLVIARTVFRTVEQTAKALGEPEFWQLGATAFGLSPFQFLR